MYENMTCARDLSDQGRDRGAQFREGDICQSIRDEIEALMGFRDSLQTESTSLVTERARLNGLIFRRSFQIRPVLPKVCR